MNDRRDLEIIYAFEARNEHAIAALKERYGPVCNSIAAGILPDGRDREECLNDAYMHLWNAIPPAKPDSLRAYLFTVVRRLALTRFRAAAADKRRAERAEEPSEELFGQTLDDALDARMLAQLLNAYLKALPQKQRVIFVRRYYYGMSIAEIAQSCALTGGNVKIILARTRAGLREYLKKEGYTV